MMPDLIECMLEYLSSFDEGGIAGLCEMYDIPSGNVLIAGYGIERSAAALIQQTKRCGKFDALALHIHRKLLKAKHRMLRKFETAFFNYNIPTPDDEIPNVHACIMELRQKAEESSAQLRTLAANIERLEHILNGKVVLQMPPEMPAAPAPLTPPLRVIARIPAKPFQSSPPSTMSYGSQPMPGGLFDGHKKTGAGQVATINQRILISITPVSIPLQADIQEAIRNIEVLGRQVKACVLLAHEQYQLDVAKQVYYDWLITQLSQSRVLIACLDQYEISERFDLDCLSALYRGVHVDLLVSEKLSTSDKVKQYQQINQWVPERLKIYTYTDNDERRFILVERLEFYLTSRMPEDPPFYRLAG